jgi:isopentenyldiphosphate isomerase
MIAHNKIIIVNEEDEIIGHQLYPEVDFSKVIYRLSHLWLTDCSGNILLQQRSFRMRLHPGKWSFAVSGTNDEGETYESNIIKETQEEINLVLVPPIELFKKRLEDIGQRTAYVSYFRHQLSIEKPEITFDTNEVAAVKWFSKKELQNDLIKRPSDFTDRISEVFNLLHS